MAMIMHKALAVLLLIMQETCFSTVVGSRAKIDKYERVS